MCLAINAPSPAWTSLMSSQTWTWILGFKKAPWSAVLYLLVVQCSGIAQGSSRPLSIHLFFLGNIGLMSFSVGMMHTFTMKSGCKSLYFGGSLQCLRHAQVLEGHNMYQLLNK